MSLIDAPPLRTMLLLLFGRYVKKKERQQLSPDTIIIYNGLFFLLICVGLSSALSDGVAEAGRPLKIDIIRPATPVFK